MKGLSYIAFAIAIALLARPHLALATSPWPETAPPGYTYRPATGCPAAPLELAADLSRRTLRDSPYPVCTDQMQSFVAAIGLARAEGKLLLVDFGATWCPWCKILDGQLASQPVRRGDGTGPDLGERFRLLKVGISAVADGKRVSVPSGEAVLDLVIGDAPGAKLRAVPFLALIDPSRRGHTFARNLDDLQMKGGSVAGFDASELRKLLVAAADSVSTGAAPPAERSGLMRRIERLIARIW